ncbi:hypothetical protein Gasu2_15120 [Galdieria sulphuraria]|uniref:Uncharacterized protein n=1 Tax=Galdieria sulphuraria TaxID=130081 RepID=M2XYX7_GALSU|nr:uncharacterized protein Gasu_38320 [Galdieria sulphuraria]EME28784.1 hypothetical protein Gasu_38320 [Galdieria sulphuraria]GJD07135.1 hypothetical protein Gasu2_15120 [Galdieria sulphuraria]|eukprot:XP_005705304.1 hypothetical protein Gasu_38320 [Galdieria sulphuraria]
MPCHQLGTSSYHWFLASRISVVFKRLRKFIVHKQVDLSNSGKDKDPEDAKLDFETRVTSFTAWLITW